MKSQKGITLVALIITIIVMLILVAVTLSIALSQNGMIENTKDAARGTNEAVIYETNIADEGVNYTEKVGEEEVTVQGVNNVVDAIVNGVDTTEDA